MATFEGGREGGQVQARDRRKSSNEKFLRNFPKSSCSFVYNKTSVLITQKCYRILGKEMFILLKEIIIIKEILLKEIIIIIEILLKEINIECLESNITAI